MTYPVEPNVDPSAPPVSSPLGQANEEEEIRQLASALAPPSTMAMSGHKAVIEAISLGDATTAPTVTVNLGGIVIPGVAVAANYAPVVGDTVVLIQQQNQYVAAFKIQDVGSKSDVEAGGWITASLRSGNSHRSGSTVMYRRVLDHGAWKMQWKGLMDFGNSIVLASALAAEYRPSESRPVAAGRSLTGGLPTLRIDFDTDGTVNVWGHSYSGGGTSSDGGWSIDHSHGGWTEPADPPDGFANSHSHGIPTTTLTRSDHSHSLNITNPPWISFNSVEYFL